MGARSEFLLGGAKIIVTPLEGVLAVVGLEVTTGGIRTGTGIRRDGRRGFQILGAATLKLWVPSDVRTNGAERRLVSESLRERVE